MSAYRRISQPGSITDGYRVRLEIARRRLDDAERCVRDAQARGDDDAARAAGRDVQDARAAIQQYREMMGNDW
jgi:hypothetical protein